MTASFRMRGLYRFQIRAMFAIFSLVGVGFLVADFVEAKPPVPVAFVLLWIAALCWLGYWFLLRICYRIDVADGVLRWATPLRSGVMPVSELRGARPMFQRININNNLSLIEGIDRAKGRPLLIYGTLSNRDDVISFLDDLRALIPDAPVRMN